MKLLPLASIVALVLASAPALLAVSSAWGGSASGSHTAQAGTWATATPTVPAGPVTPAVCRANGLGPYPAERTHVLAPEDHGAFRARGSQGWLIIGTEGKDSIKGSNGNDCIDGRGGNDKLEGGGRVSPLHDVLIGGAGSDECEGASGTIYVDCEGAHAASAASPTATATPATAPGAPYGPPALGGDLATPAPTPLAKPAPPLPGGTVTPPVGATPASGR